MSSLWAGREGVYKSHFTFSRNFLCLVGCLVFFKSYSFITREKVHILSIFVKDRVHKTWVSGDL